MFDKTRRGEKKEFFFKQFFPDGKNNAKKMALLWTMISVTMVIIVIVWNFFFKYNISLITQGPKNQEEEEKRKEELGEIKEKFNTAFENWQKNYQEAIEKKGQQKADDIPVPEEENTNEVPAVEQP